MGEHKHNPNCELAKQGKLPPKKKGMSKRERDALLTSKIKELTGINEIEKALGGNPYDY